jgi:amino acid transporter
MELDSKYKLKRKLGFWAAFGGSVGLVVSGTAMLSVANVGGIAGNAAWLPALIALIPMLAVAAAYGELTAMFPGGGMIGDYTGPALGKYWALISVLCGYVLLIACDGGTQQVVGALALERATGIPYLLTMVVFLILVLCVNLFGVQFYGRFEIVLTLAMMIVFLLLGILGFFGAGQAFGGVAEAVAVDVMKPQNGWNMALSTCGTAIWWYIGFEFVCPLAEENKKPYKNIPYALLIGLVLIFLADIFFIYGGLKFSDIEIMATSSTPHIDVAVATFGNTGFVLMTVITILACLTTAVSHMAALPRMLYGLAHKHLVPRCFAYVHPRFRTPWVGIFFTLGLMVLAIIYMVVYGTDAEIMIMLINIACCTWLISYAIALINVLYFRKKAADYPRLWKVPAGPFVMVIGLVGLAYCMWTMRYVWLISGIAMAVFLLYGVIWFRYKKIPLGEKESITELVRNIQSRSEELPEWDEAVNRWIAEQGLEKKDAEQA